MVVVVGPLRLAGSKWYNHGMATNPTVRVPYLDADLPYAQYGRTSRLNGRDAGENLSRGEQFAAIPTIAKRFGLPLTDEEFYDADASGSTFDRPEWERVLEGIRSGEYAGVVAFNLKRISRGKTAEVLAMVEDVESLGGKIYDQTGLVSVDDADAEVMTTVQAMMARREWRERRAYLLSSVESAIARGVHLGIPYGYQRPVKGTPLQILEHEAAQVRRMFELRASGMTWPKIAAACNADGAAPRPYRRDKEEHQARWTHKTVRQIVLNPVYTGLAYNGVLEDGSYKHSKAGAHDAIVTPELYGLANRTRGTKPQGPADGYLLTGLVRCHSCGYSMVYSKSGGRSYLRCIPKQHGGAVCSNPAMVPADQLEEYVVDRFERDFLLGLRGRQVADGALADADAALEVSKDQLRAAMRYRRELGDASALEREIADEDVEEARSKLRAAELALHDARMAELGADLPPELTVDVFRRQPMPERRHWMSLVYAGVAVRAARRWREPAPERVALVRAETPRLVGAALRRRITGLSL